MIPFHLLFRVAQVLFKSLLSLVWEVPLLFGWNQLQQTCRELLPWCLEAAPQEIYSPLGQHLSPMSLPTVVAMMISVFLMLLYLLVSYGEIMPYVNCQISLPFCKHEWKHPGTFTNFGVQRWHKDGN